MRGVSTYNGVNTSSSGSETLMITDIPLNLVHQLLHP